MHIMTFAEQSMKRWCIDEQWLPRFYMTAKAGHVPRLNLAGLQAMSSSV
jgi:hypothetical protein